MVLTSGCSQVAAGVAEEGPTLHPGLAACRGALSSCRCLSARSPRSCLTLFPSPICRVLEILAVRGFVAGSAPQRWCSAQSFFALYKHLFAVTDYLIC